MLRCFSRFFLWLAVAGPVAAAMPEAAGPPLLQQALGKVAQNFDRWAYTETRVMTDEHGKTQPETVIRFDPSKPYAEQYEPLKIDGKPPTERQRRDFRRRGEKRGEKFAKEEAEGKTPGRELPRLGINGSTASVDLAHAVIANETADSVTFELPLRNDGHGSLPVEKFQLFARVNRATGAFENVALRVRSAFRLKLVVKVKSGEASVDFAPVDATHDPVAAKITGDATASILFMSFGGSFEVRRAAFQRVKPYGERFGVKIGPLKALDF